MLYRVKIEMDVTADSPEEAIEYAISDFLEGLRNGSIDINDCISTN